MSCDIIGSEADNSRCRAREMRYVRFGPRRARTVAGVITANNAATASGSVLNPPDDEEKVTPSGVRGMPLPTGALEQTQRPS